VTITNSAGRQVSVRDIGEQHVLEDFNKRFIPSAQDYLQEMEFKDWMLNGKTGTPSSYERLLPKKPVREEILTPDIPNMLIDGRNNRRYLD
jgi:hypothetical protein